MFTENFKIIKFTKGQSAFYHHHKTAILHNVSNKMLLPAREGRPSNTTPECSYATAMQA